LKVIAVPFIEGSHIPQNKDQLLGVANFLKKMHDNGFVHGDIRLLNIEKPEDSQLIDFDFGGKDDDDSLVYPPGYIKVLRDGDRVGIAGQRIRKWHDVHALYHAFDKLLFMPRAEWAKLKGSTMKYLSIDDLIQAMEALVFIRDDPFFIFQPDLLDQLEKNTKLGTRSQSQKTREGDAVSPAKLANN
jgi:serine/threonine protein kinase